MKTDYWLITAKVTKTFKTVFEEPVTAEEAAHLFQIGEIEDILDENEISVDEVIDVDPLGDTIFDEELDDED